MEMHNTTSHEEKAKLMKWATYASVATAAIIIAIEIFAWLLTDSISILSSLVDSVLDILVSLVNLTAVRYALQPADEDHRFGHGKAEDIAAFAQSAFICGSAVFIAAEAFRRVAAPRAIEHIDIGLWVMVASTLLTLMLILFQRHVIRKTQSLVIQTDYLHYVMDIGVNIGVILSLIIFAIWNVSWVDPLVAIGIAIYMIRGAWRVGQQAFHKLMDKEFENADRDRIKSIVLEHPEIDGMHELRTRYSGIHSFIQFHLELNGDIALNKAHTISEEVERNIQKVFPNAEITIHQDPASPEELSLQAEQVKAIRV